MNPKIKINNFAATGEIDNRDPRTNISINGAKTKFNKYFSDAKNNKNILLKT